MPQQIVAIGVSHKSAPIEVRERLAVSSEQLSAALARLKGYIPAGAILSTCNRTEVYGTVDDAEEGFSRLLRFLCDVHGVKAEDIASHLYRYTQEEAVRHLFRVASGIDSMIVGEYEVLGQVRDALVAASEEQELDRILSEVFHASLRVGRKARRETLISRQAVSVSYTAVQLAKQVFDGDLSGCGILVVSAGQAGKLTAKALWESGAKELFVTNRTYEKAQELASALGGRVVPFGRLAEKLTEVDIVISATGAPGFVLTRDITAQAMRQRDGRTLCLIDIAVPRDVDPEVAAIPNVYLFDIDDLQQVSEINLREREKEVQKVEALVQREAARFMAWWNTLDVVPVIAALRGKAEETRRREVEKTLKKLPKLSAQERENIEQLSRALVNRLLHDPVTALKKHGRRYGRLDAVKELFHLDSDGQ